VGEFSSVHSFQPGDISAKKMEEPDSKEITNLTKNTRPRNPFQREKTYQVIEEEKLQDISQIEMADQSLRKSEEVAGTKLLNPDSH